MRLVDVQAVRRMTNGPPPPKSRAQRAAARPFRPRRAERPSAAGAREARPKCGCRRGNPACSRAARQTPPIDWRHRDCWPNRLDRPAPPARPSRLLRCCLRPQRAVIHAQAELLRSLAHRAPTRHCRARSRRGLLRLGSAGEQHKREISLLLRRTGVQHHLLRSRSKGSHLRSNHVATPAGQFQRIRAVHVGGCDRFLAGQAVGGRNRHARQRSIARLNDPANMEACDGANCRRPVASAPPQKAHRGPRQQSAIARLKGMRYRSPAARKRILVFLTRSRSGVESCGAPRKPGLPCG